MNTKQKLNTIKDNLKQVCTSTHVYSYRCRICESIKLVDELLEKL